MREKNELTDDRSPPSGLDPHKHTSPNRNGATQASSGVGRADMEALSRAVKEHRQWVGPLREAIGRTIVGQKYLVDRLLVALLADGHVLLEGMPGLAKTLALKTLAESVDADFHRIQFTPDMLPADILGTEVYNPHKVSFEVKRGPVFANMVLADEINRAPAKVQSGLLEAMQEHQVTIGSETFPLPSPFLVMATQNPIEQEGTYPLPEAQVDRFMLKVVVDYPSVAEEREIIDVVAEGQGAEPEAVVSAQEILNARKIVKSIYMDEKVKDYIVSLVHATRDPKHYGLDLAPYIKYGASPRATLGLVAASKAVAFLQGRAYVTPQDVKTILLDVLRHRIGMTYLAEAEDVSSQDVVSAIRDAIHVP